MNLQKSKQYANGVRTDLQNKAEYLEIIPHIYGQWIFNKDSETTKREKFQPVIP